MTDPRDQNQPGQGQWGQGQSGQGQWNQNQWGQQQPGQGQWPQSQGGQGQWGSPPVSIGGAPPQWQQGQHGQPGQPGLVDRYERGVDRAMVHVDRALGCGQLVYNAFMLLLMNLFFLGFLGLSYWFFSESLHLARNGTPATGVVVDFSESNSADSGVTYSPIVEFKVGRKTYEFDSGISSSPKAYDVGEEVPILYDPENPETAEIKSWMTSPALFAGVFGIQLIAFLIANVLAIRRIMRGESIDDE
jgi:hypothetical protein